MRIGSIIIFRLSKLWKPKFFILCDVIFLVRLQEKFDIDHSKPYHAWTSRTALSIRRPLAWGESGRSDHINPFTPKSDQFQTSPAASPEILHHAVWRIWPFTAQSDGKLLLYQFSLPHLYISLKKVCENVLFELGTETVKKKCIGEVVRIGSIIIFHLSKLWKAKFFILCDAIFLVRLQGKFDIDHSFIGLHSRFLLLLSSAPRFSPRTFSCWLRLPWEKVKDHAWLRATCPPRG